MPSQCIITCFRKLFQESIFFCRDCLIKRFTDISSPGLLPQSDLPLNFVPSKFVPRTFLPRTFRPQGSSSPAQLLPQGISSPGQFFPNTNSSPGQFFPSTTSSIEHFCLKYKFFPIKAILLKLIYQAFFIKLACSKLIIM